MRSISAGKGAVYGTLPLTRAAGGGSWEFHYDSDKVGDEVRRAAARARARERTYLRIPTASTAGALLRLWEEASLERVLRLVVEPLGRARVQWKFVWLGEGVSHGAQAP
jgi:hypothetical protein